MMTWFMIMAFAENSTLIRVMKLMSCRTFSISSRGCNDRDIKILSTKVPLNEVSRAEWAVCVT